MADKKSAKKKAAKEAKAAKPEVRAAGGLVWRSAVVADAAGSTADGIEVVLIHRPRYDDWSFPKGKLDRGESWEDAARREVEEETGLACELGDELPPARYRDTKGRLKEVRYWVMRPVAVGPWAPNDEVDRRRWVPLAEAADLLTYEHDRRLLEAFVRAHADGEPGR
ncbi:MAG TPA: NUDIX hydrolase [Acidimicrobiales bacterium]